MTKANNYGGNPDGLGTKSYRIRQENHDLVCSDYDEHNEHTPSGSSPQSPPDGTWGQFVLHRLAPFLFKRHDDFVDYSGAM